MLPALLCFFDNYVTVSVKLCGFTSQSGKNVSRRKRFSLSFFLMSSIACYHSGEVLFNPRRGSGLGGQGAREDNGPLPQLGQPLNDLQAFPFEATIHDTLQRPVRGTKAEDFCLRSCQNCQLMTSADRSWGRGRECCCVHVLLGEQFTLCTPQSKSESSLRFSLAGGYRTVEENEQSTYSREDLILRGLDRLLFGSHETSLII